MAELQGEQQYRVYFLHDDIIFKVKVPPGSRAEAERVCSERNEQYPDILHWVGRYPFQEDDAPEVVKAAFRRAALPGGDTDVA